MFFHAASIYIWERRKEKKKNNLELNSKEKIIKHFITQPLFRKCGRILKKEKKKKIIQRFSRSIYLYLGSEERKISRFNIEEKNNPTFFHATSIFIWELRKRKFLRSNFEEIINPTFSHNLYLYLGTEKIKKE